MAPLKRLSLAALVAGLAAPASAQSVDQWDSDGDGGLTREEFVQAFSERGVFDEWDRNDDGEIAAQELSGGIYDRFDIDRSGSLEAAEQATYEQSARPGGIWDSTAWPRPESATDWSEGWDIDGDGVLLRNEFRQGFAETGLFAAWDADESETISEEELARAVFDRYDENGDGVIEDPELTQLGDDMGEGGFWDF